MKRREEGIRSQVGGNQSGELWHLKIVNEHAIKLGYMYSQRQTVGSPQFCAKSYKSKRSKLYRFYTPGGAFDTPKQISTITIHFKKSFCRHAWKNTVISSKLNV